MRRMRKSWGHGTRRDRICIEVPQLEASLSSTTHRQLVVRPRSPRAYSQSALWEKRERPKPRSLNSSVLVWSEESSVTAPDVVGDYGVQAETADEQRPSVMAETANAQLQEILQSTQRMAQTPGPSGSRLQRGADSELVVPRVNRSDTSSC
jgi:hypothetical protein